MEKRKRNALEVTSIGRLYQGPWEKRYWSSSRGKDRYPYPVGYQAVRSHNGHTYQMEVKEGARGPLFVVTLGEGVTCCAETPNIAWENAMKKESPRSKKMQGRLSNVTSDGAELFGFLNPLVQRLLRELVSSHDGEAQPSNETFKSSEKLDTAVSGRLSKVSIERAVPTSLSWSSSGSLSVRKSRTSIVNSGSGHPVMEQRAISFKKQTKKPASSDPSQSANNILLNKDVQAMGIQQKCYSKHSTVKSKDTNQGCVSPARFQARMSKTGGRKCLKLAKPAKKSEDFLRPENDAANHN